MSEVEQMPLEIWTDINGNATRTQFKGGVKYIRADERDRLAKALKALVSEVGSYTVERQYYSREEASKDLDRREKALLAQLQQAKAALTPAGQRWTRERPKNEGWYWLVEDEWGGPEVVLVKSANLLLRVYFTSGRREDVGTVNAEWYGPIQRPLTPNEAME